MRKEKDERKKLMKTAVVVLAATAVCTVFATKDEARVRDNCRKLREGGLCYHAQLF
jgi:hypothetical protein